jgi:hypothetical protein
MSAAVRAVFAIFCFSVCAHAQTRTLAVYSDSAQHLDSSAMHALQVELQRVLAPAGIEPISLQTGAKNTELPEVQLAVVGTFQGDCSVESLLEQSARAVQTRTLAESSVSSGHVLPYFRVDCARIIRTLSPALRPLNVPMRENILGRALARAIAHEIYHILAQTTGHEESGIAKASLSMSDLFSSQFDFTPESLRRMQAPPSPKISKEVLAVLTRR